MEAWKHGRTPAQKGSQKGVLNETVNIRLGPLIRILVEITNQDNIGEALRAKGQRVPNAPCHHYRSPGVHFTEKLGLCPFAVKASAHTLFVGICAYSQTGKTILSGLLNHDLGIIWA
ncbi:hypothetical protein AFLA_002893 [Aspergillus flavus NRRL3357]|nr:hypothetical protein AFLA_002893 [Aspergillus flavus NRRL3357]